MEESLKGIYEMLDDIFSQNETLFKCEICQIDANLREAIDSKVPMFKLEFNVIYQLKQENEKRND